jgi:isopenicillin N synthase-like dioxygenase
MSFASIPVLDLSLADDPTTKPAFLADLRHAIIDIGFLYIKNFGIEQEFLDTVCTVGKEFFDLPNEEKLRIEMKHGPHFLGYSRLGNEITARKTDFREQVDVGTELPTPNDQDPRYRWLYGRYIYNRILTIGPNMWPREDLLPGFRDVIEKYMNLMGGVAAKFLTLVAEAMGLNPDGFDQFFEPKGSRWEQQHKLKIVKYPDTAELPASATTQGVGPHKGCPYVFST